MLILKLSLIFCACVRTNVHTLCCTCLFTLYLICEFDWFLFGVGVLFDLISYCFVLTSVIYSRMFFYSSSVPAPLLVFSSGIEIRQFDLRTKTQDIVVDRLRNPVEDMGKR